MANEQPPQPPATATPLPRIWTAHCPFNKAGAPVLGNFGKEIRGVVIMEMTTWNKLCQDVPALQTMQFEVGTFS
jgi:hypothetical protein